MKLILNEKFMFKYQMEEQNIIALRKSFSKTNKYYYFYHIFMEFSSYNR